MRIQRVTRDEFDVETPSFLEVPVIRIQRKTKFVGNKNGTAVFTSLRIFFEPDSGILATDKPMPDGVSPLEILSFYPVTDAEGEVHHIEVDV